MASGFATGLLVELLSKVVVQRLGYCAHRGYGSLCEDGEPDYRRPTLGERNEAPHRPTRRMAKNLICLILGHRERGLSELVDLSVQKPPSCNPRRSPPTRQKYPHSRVRLKVFKKETRHLGVHCQMKVVDCEPGFSRDSRKLLRDDVR